MQLTEAECDRGLVKVFTEAQQLWDLVRAPARFQAESGSSLAGDDRVTHPYNMTPRRPDRPRNRA